jgi:hypothetical protein
MKKLGIIFQIVFLLATLSTAFAQSDETETKNKGEYDGKYKKGLRNGKGVCYWEDGKRFVGRWKYDKMHGLGKMFYTNGDIYEGDWENGYKQGTGVYIWKNGSKYSGGFSLGKKEGYGALKSTDGSKHAGYWKNDVAHGEGKHTWRDGTKYQGGWQNGKMEGDGVMEYPDRSIVQGEWKDNKYVPCDCETTKPISVAYQAHDAVFVGRVVSISRIGEKTDEVILEVSQFWKGKLGFGRRIVLQAGFSSCDLVFFEGESYLIFAKEEQGRYMKATQCSPSGMVLNKQAEINLLETMPCQGTPLKSPYGITETDWVCGCDGKRYKNPFEAAKAGVLYWKKGKCGE